MSKVLVICRGAPASGKSTAALAWVHLDRTRRVRVNRDTLRAMGHGGWVSSTVEHDIITPMQHTLIRTMLLQHIAVVCDDTNLRNDTMAGLLRVARYAGAHVAIWDFTDVPREVCIERDAQRTGRARVGAQVIDEMYARYIDGQPYPLPLPDSGTYFKRCTNPAHTTPPPITTPEAVW